MKRILLVLAATAMILLPATGARAGSWFGGVKYWQTTWDSGILDWLEKDIAISFEQARLPFSARRDPGSGFLAGPLLSYRTDDGRWSFSFAPMIFSSFSQGWDGSAGTIDLDGNVQLDRTDYDLAATHPLSDRYKIFYGLKLQDMDMDFTLTYTTASSGSITNVFKVDARAIIPTVGLGAVYTLGPKTVASGQVGLLYAFTDLFVTNDLGETDNIWPHPGFGYNLEGNITWQAAQEILLQGGLRYQLFTIEARGPGRDERTRSYDITYGLTLTAVYTF